MEYYSRSLVKALRHAYPEIGFDENKFPIVSSKFPFCIVFLFPLSFFFFIVSDINLF